MNSILLIGELNNTLGNIYNSLKNSYRVQISKTDYSEVEGIIKIVKPDLVLISMYGVTVLDKNIIEYFKNPENRIPVIFIGTVEECRSYISVYDDSYFDFLERPNTQKDLLEKCAAVLNYTDNREKLLDKANEKNKEKSKILVIDDSGVFLRAINALLEPKYATFLAKSGQKGIDIAKEQKPDMILLDYEMPEMDGRETLAKLRECEETSDIPVVFLTGVSDKNHIMKVLQMQPQGYLLKPVDSADLEKKISEIINR